MWRRCRVDSESSSGYGEKGDEENDDDRGPRGAGSGSRECSASHIFTQVFPVLLIGEIKIKMLTGSGAPHVARSTRRRLESREPATRALTSSLCEIQIVFVND